jgi:PAS domain S-box-containing protein
MELTGQVTARAGVRPPGQAWLSVTTGPGGPQAFDAVLPALADRLGVRSVAVAAHDGRQYLVVAVRDGLEDGLRPGAVVPPDRLLVHLDDEHGRPVGGLHLPGVDPAALDAAARDTLELLGRLVLLELQRQRDDHRPGGLDQRLTEVSTTFIDLPDDQIDLAIADALREVAGEIGADAAAVHRTVGDDSGMRVTHHWPGDGPVPDPWPEITDLAAARHGEPVLVPGRDGGSVLVLPFRAKGEVLGRVAFSSPQPRPDWEGTGRALRPLADILTLAVARRRASAERAESERRYRSLVDAISDVIVHIDATGRVSYVNQAWIDLTGLTLENMVGRDAFDSVHPDDRIRAAEHVSRALQGARGEVAEVRFVDSGGGVRWMEVKGQVQLDADGGLAGLTGVLHDVTARRQAEAEVRAAAEAADLARREAERVAAAAEAARDEAVQAARAKGEFLSRMSHELRTSLNAILGFGQVLQLGALSAEDADSVAQIVRAGRNLLDLITEVLDVVRVESGSVALSLEPVQVGDVVDESLDAVRAAAAARGIRLLAPAGAGQAFAQADRQRLRQVLVNLLSNAVKYNRDGGEVVVGCGPTPPGEVPAGLPDLGRGWLRLSVADTGVGIAAEHLEDVFVPFERLGAEGGSVEGSGVGLALTRTLVEALGGRIELRSELGHGTVVLVDLPAAQAVLDTGPVGAAAGAVTHTLLYVEDNVQNVTLVRRLLTRRPHVRLVVVRNGAEAVEVVSRLLPDLVLLDLHLPGLPGPGVLAALRGSDDPRVRDVPVVVLTADLSPGTQEEAIRAGANTFLPKPIDVPRLLEVIDAHLPRPV